ncbi:MAG: hypothetical protein KI790_18525 [Cyclobacteriaceae bacterium]|nr:hypothetical protein [Cyclobacteriaceae bacterium HetDA_MAG_MS6]
MRNVKKISILSLLILISNLVSAQGHDGGGTLEYWFGVLELPFLFLCMYFALRTAAALKGGIFGHGMKLMAWGFVVMAVGHMHMQINHFFGLNIFNSIFGYTLGQVIWFIALVVTWTLSGLGFYYIFKASRVA